ncbi:hypothetical protein [Acinetobacter venetianus]|uniref:hypothetical protein n=1 Tax=Acinetobacter venetianus TaxID=52133 RepID=UPI00214FDC3C|nr:hypothetical protein [Acinetobacter venetianus]MCR4530836.1 hypothetical protein [Acinetobacter venetianus]
MDTFMLCPLQEGYGFTPGNNLREQATEGGMPRQVPFFIGAAHQSNVSVALKDERERQYFWAFWRTKQRKPDNWLWELSLDNGVKEACECRFTSNSLPSESMRDGRVIKISFQVYVKPVQRDPDLDQAIVEIWQSGVAENPIEPIPNEWMPDALGVD